MSHSASHGSHEIHRLRDGAWQRAADCVAVEEPLEIRVSHRGAATPLSVTMRTPGQDFELAAGFLFGEGVVSARGDIEDIARDDSARDEERENIVVVTLRDGVDFDPSTRRSFLTTSACGVCGKSSLDALALDGCRPLRATGTIAASAILAMPDALRRAQTGFAATGGVHAVGLFTREGALVQTAEDVGRHNAFDKLVGARFLAGTLVEVEDMAVLLSGRASFELLQKSLRARIPIVAAVGAPSSLAVEIAETFNITLAGFVKPGGFNAYAGRGRISD